MKTMLLFQLCGMHWEGVLSTN